MNHSISTTTGKTKLKIILLGSQGVGKSSIIDQYINNKFEDNYNATVGIDFLAKNISLNGKNYRLQLWDTAGQQRFRSLIPSYLKDAHCAFIIYDVGKKSSLNDIDFWIKMFNDNKGGDGFVFLVGNKMDLQYREVSEEQGRKKAESWQAPFCQISAKTGKNVAQVFNSLIEHFQDRVNGRIKEPKRHIQNEVVRQQKQEKQQDEVTKKPQQTQTKLTQSSRAVQLQQMEPVVLKNKKMEDTIKVSQKECC